MWLFIYTNNNNNNMTSQNFNSFSDGKKLEHSGLPPVVTYFCHIFNKKTSVVANVNLSLDVGRGSQKCR